MVDTTSTIQRCDSDEPKVINIGKEARTSYGISPTEANVILVIRWGKAPGLKSPAILKQKMAWLSACHVRARSNYSNGAQSH